MFCSLTIWRVHFTKIYEPEHQNSDTFEEHNFYENETLQNEIMYS